MGGWPIVVAWSETTKQSVAEWDPWSGPSADEARVEDKTRAREMLKAHVGNGLEVLDES